VQGKKRHVERGLKFEGTGRYQWRFKAKKKQRVRNGKLGGGRMGLKSWVREVNRRIRTTGTGRETMSGKEDLLEVTHRKRGVKRRNPTKRGGVEKTTGPQKNKTQKLKWLKKNVIVSKKKKDCEGGRGGQKRKKAVTRGKPASRGNLRWLGEKKKKKP